MNWKILSKLLKKDITNDSMAYTSYLAFVKNNNADEVDAAFGKGNEDKVMGVGKALAMYAKFKGETDDFSELQKCETLEDCNGNLSVIEEIKQNDLLFNFIGSNEYVVNNIMKYKPDEIVLYDNGVSEYIDISNIARTKAGYDDVIPESNYWNTYGSLSVNENNITIQAKSIKSTGKICFTTVFLPFLSSDLIKKWDLAGYKYMNFTGSLFTHVGNTVQQYMTISLSNIGTCMSYMHGYAYSYNSNGTVTSDGVFKNSVPITAFRTNDSDSFDGLTINIRSYSVSSAVYTSTLVINKLWLSKN